MKRKIGTRLLAWLLGMLLVITSFSGLSTSTILPPASAAETNWSFDLGGTPENGYTSVSATQGYNAALGYGFRNTAGVKDVTASGTGAYRDAVQFTDTENANNTFDVDLPNGLYRITVTLGYTNRTSVYMEGMLQIVNMTGDLAKDSILLPITDGQLNIRAAAGKAGYAFSISTLEIQWVSSDTQLPPTVWMCGDSTVCNYYPLDTSVQGGWGQMLPQYLDPAKWQVRNMAASGQYAKGFVEAGQFDAIETYGKAGDVYIISIGINDTNYSNAEEYYAVVTDMVVRAKAKGMQVVLVKQQGRATDITNNPNLKGRWFGTTLDQIGTEQNVQVVNLFQLFFDYCASIGQEATTALYMDGDTLHPNRQGAMKLAELAAGAINWEQNAQLEPGAEIAENTWYLLRNKNSDMYMAVESESGADGANVSQANCTKLSDAYLWRVQADVDGYYEVYSALAGGETYLLDLAYGAPENGTNIGIWSDTQADAQKFKFLANEDGSYCIATKSSGDQRVVEVKDALETPGGNIQQWDRNNHNCQSWVLEPVTLGTDLPEGIVGDLNGDQMINGIDFALMRQQVVSPTMTRHQRRFADTDADGSVGMADCVAMQQYLLSQKYFAVYEKHSDRYYAIDMAFCQGVEETVNAGFQDEAYVNLDNCIGSFIEWCVTVPEGGNYFCSFRNANGSANNRPMKIEVNGAADYWMQDFLSTGAWTSWTDRGIVLPLNAGENVIRMTSMSEEGGPNLDTLYLEQTEEPIAETYIPPQDDPTPDPEPDSGATIYIAGDSTVQTYRASYAPQQGWGAYLGNYLPDGYTVSNHAIAGRSSKSFYDNGRLNTILEQMQPGDYLLVQFGINDSAYNNAERYAPVSGSVPGTEGSFEYYIAKYIEGALEKGGTPVLVTTVLGLKAYNSSTGQFGGSYQNYCDAMKQLAAYYNIPCIDLNSLMVDHYNAIGYDTAYTYHLISTELSDTDMTHFTETGASAVAQLVAQELQRILP